MHIVISSKIRSSSPTSSNNNNNLSNQTNDDSNHSLLEENELTPNTSSSSLSSSHTESATATATTSFVNSTSQPTQSYPHSQSQSQSTQSAQINTNLTPKEKYQQIQKSFLRYYESLGIQVQNNPLYSTYVQHLALYNCMYSDFLEKSNPLSSFTASPFNINQNSPSPLIQPVRREDDLPPLPIIPEQAEAAMEAAAPAAPVVPPPPPRDQDLGLEREDDWLGMLHNFCSFILLFSIIFYYSSLERFIIIFTIATVLILYHNGWLTLQRRQINNNQVNRQAEQNNAQNVQGEGQDININNNNNNERQNETTNQQPNNNNNNNNDRPNVIQCIFNFIFAFFTSLIPDRPRNAVN
jgi:hypothetical protein